MISNEISQEIINRCGEGPLKEWLDRRGVEICGVEEIRGSGSTRRYSRLIINGGEDSVILTEGKNRKENGTFVALSRLMRSHALPVPEVYACSEESGCYLQEDLGEEDLLSHLEEGNVRESLRMLLSFQMLPEEEWSGAVFCRPFDSREVLNDLHYFKYCFLKPSGIEFDEERLEAEIDDIVATFCNEGREYEGLMLRDFQSRNILLKDGKPWLIDFQGARLGNRLYDLVSLLWQSRAGFAPGFRRRMVDFYCEQYCHLLPVSDSGKMKETLPVVVLVRMLQTLGAYGFRGLIEKKSNFITTIPTAIGNLVRLLESAVASGCPVEWKTSPAERWPELFRISHLLRSAKRFQGEEFPQGVLTVSVGSFSYKRGYPEDYSGNGGGFMFDCRALPNPGRYAEYKKKSGLDSEVIAFLEDKEEIGYYLEHVRAIVGQSVERYIERGFTSLQVFFGCTGGQHRSVYSAESIARWLSERYPQVSVHLTHRETPHWPEEARRYAPVTQQNGLAYLEE